MRRLLRWAFDVAALLSAVLFVGVFVSLFRPIPPQTPPGAPVARLQYFNGRIRYERWHPPITAYRSYTNSGRRERDESVITSGRNVEYDVTVQPNMTLIVRTFDYWQLNLWRAMTEAVTLTAILGIIGWKFGRRQPARAGYCGSCGYDLRATPGRCPECGAVPNESALSIRQSHSN